jgi:hypothetical protein
MFVSDEIIKGERLQQIADTYLGVQEDFFYNPLIRPESHKQCNLDTLNNSYNNPKILFCYSHRLELLRNKIDFFINPFVLISHNSDENIVETDSVKYIANHPLLIKWYGQNLAYSNDKLHILPIGMANNQWPHGDVSFFNDTQKIEKLHMLKQNKVYFNFSIQTNPLKRNECYTKLKNKIIQQPNVDPLSYLHNLSTYEFCICPEGNGYDSHRLWEALYVKCIPIVVKSKHIDILQSQLNIPLVILDSWDSFDINKLDYSIYMFDNSYYEKITMSYYKTRFQSHFN